MVVSGCSVPFDRRRCPLFRKVVERKLTPSFFPSFLPKITTISVGAATTSSTAAIGENVLSVHRASGTVAKCAAYLI